MTIGVAITLALLTTEARGNVPILCHRLLDRTAARLPAEMRDRREEWESELTDAADRPITQMVIAVRIWRDGRSLAQEAAAGVAEAEGRDGRRKGEQSARFAALLALLSERLGPSLNGRAARTYIIGIGGMGFMVAGEIGVFIGDTLLAIAGLIFFVVTLLLLVRARR